MEVDMYWKTGDLVYEGVPLGDAIELTKEQYDRYVNPTLAQRWEDFIASIASLPQSAQRMRLYQHMRYKLVGDVSNGAPDVSRPFFENMTVDEMSAKAVQYLGDNQDIVVACFAGKAEAKSYIRSLF